MADELVVYRVRPVTRFNVTRYYESAAGLTGGSESVGEFDNEKAAYRVATAMHMSEPNSVIAANGPGGNCPKLPD